MNAHPRIANLAAGALEPVALPAPLGMDSLDLEIAPARESSAPDKAPVVECPASTVLENAPGRRWRTPAIIASLALHVAAAWAIGEHLMQGPLEADDPDAVSVELVVEPPVPQAPAASASPGAVLADAGLDATAESPLTEIPPPMPLPAFDPSLALSAPPVPQADENTVAPEPAAETLAVLAAPPKIEEAGVPPPQHEARAKAPQRPKAEAPAKPKTEPAKAPQRRETSAAKAKPEPAKAGKSGPAATRAKTTAAGAGGHSTGNAQRPAGASAAAKAAYGAKLLSHVQRFKRYPAAAAGATGVARLAVTIGRDGSLRSARVVSGSGNAALDAEARATASRAAPYPRPPDGVGGATLTFSVALKFTK